jgi:hypothetical protein
MRRRARCLVVLLLPVVLLASMPAAAGASVLDDYARVIRSRHAGATFVGVDGCLQTEVFVSAMDATFGARQGPVNKQGLVGVFVARRDICATPGPKGYPLVYSADGMTLDRLSTTPQFTSAWVQATIPASDMDGGPITIRIDLQWLPTTPLERSRVHGNAWLPEDVRFGAHVHTFSHELRAAALAWGEISLGGETLTLARSTDAQMEQVRYFCQVIQHPRGGAEVAC